jgi:hypothetical protein
MMRTFPALLVLVAPLALAAAPDDKPKLTAREALKPFNELVGGWKGVGEPEGTLQEKQRGFWRETVTWGWKFKGDDAWLTVAFGNGKHFKNGELRYLADKNLYRLELLTKDNKPVVFEGELIKNGRSLVVERVDEKKETQRLTFNLVGEIRFVYLYETRPENRQLFTKSFQVASTKEGESFGTKEKKPECIVSGGLGTSTVSYKGVTYYVCCTGCRDEFNANPEKYVKEWNEKKAKEAGK